MELQFTIPSANTDNTRPGNVARVDVYAFTGPVTAPAVDVLRLGTRVASVAVKAPRDPDVTFDPDDPDQTEGDVEPPQGEGLDQGARARVLETLTEPAPAAADTTPPPVRMYVSVGITTRGRPGPISRRATVSLAPPPPAPQRPVVTYTEEAVTVQWPQLAASDVGYHVYEVVDGSSETLLTKAPIAETQFVDARIAWGSTRCYGVRSIETVGVLAVESEATETVCVTLADTFPPAAPKGLQAVASEGAISLIWDANAEADLDGYFLLRAKAPGDELAPVMASPIRETAFQDRVPSGVRYVYALQAVDRFGNRSAISERTEETAR